MSNSPNRAELEALRRIFRREGQVDHDTLAGLRAAGWVEYGNGGLTPAGRARIGEWTRTAARSRLLEAMLDSARRLFDEGVSDGQLDKLLIKHGLPRVSPGVHPEPEQNDVAAIMEDQGASIPPAPDVVERLRKFGWYMWDSNCPTEAGMQVVSSGYDGLQDIPYESRRSRRKSTG